MKLLVRLILLLCLLQAPAIADEKAANLRDEKEATADITIRSLMQEADKLALEVTIAFPGESDGETDLRLPNEWGGLRRYYRAIRDLSAENADLLDDDSNPAVRRLKHEPNAKITIKYRVVDDEEGPDFNGQGNDYRVQIRNGYLFALGEAYIIQPENIHTEDRVRVNVDLPDGVNWASDLQHTSDDGRLSFRDLMESVLLAGDIRVVDAGGGARLALHGKLDSRGDEEWRGSFQKISAAQRRYWGAKEEPFLVTILAYPPSLPGAISIGGTGRSDAFAFFATQNAEPQRLDEIMSHEMMHTWVPRRIGGFKEGPGMEADYWLSEGFTDWTSWRVLVRSGIWSPEQFVAAYNERLKDYDLSPARDAPNARIMAEFWTDRSVGDLPYRRGMLFATYLNDKILKATQDKKDFDDALLRMQSLASAHPDQSAAQLLVVAIREVASIDITEDLDRYIENGEPIDFGETLFAPLCAMEWVEEPEFHRGFDVQKTMANENVIAGVIENGPAWKAGLRDGMKILARKGGEVGNSQVELVYEVDDGGETKTLKWLPAGSKTLRYRRLHLVGELNSERREDAINRFGGAEPEEN